MRLLPVSVIVTTYNWPEALGRVLQGLCHQNYQRFEVIIADDGSNESTAQVIREFKSKVSFPLLHCWQPDEGFRAAMARNRAVAHATGDYLIFLDGDCIPLPNFVANHRQLAEKGWFVAGNRVLLSQSLTNDALAQLWSLEHWSLPKWGMMSLMGECNRVLPLCSLPLGRMRKLTPLKWQGVKSCNLGLWRRDYIAVNGMDENFTGWGFEDSDLVVRLQKKKIFRKSGKCAVGVLHLWHPFQERDSARDNAHRLQETLASLQCTAAKGIDQYLEGYSCGTHHPS